MLATLCDGHNSMNARRKDAYATAAAEARRPLLATIRSQLPTLNPTERLIGESVLGDPEKVLSSSVAELGKSCGASAGAIVNFCQKLGLKGFSDFRIALARDLAQAGLPAGKDQSGGSPLERVFLEHAQSLKETLQVNTQETFDEVAHALEKARRIEFYAIGLSYPVAYTAS